MYKYDKHYFDKRASETGFIRDNLEKVYRLADVLQYINTNPLHKNCLALKGGTAINLTVFNMPRLSLDIDLDFCKFVTREEMIEYRKRINEDLIAFLQTQGYALNLEKGKNPHSLDSWVFWYINSAGNRDNLKVLTPSCPRTMEVDWRKLPSLMYNIGRVYVWRWFFWQSAIKNCGNCSLTGTCERKIYWQQQE